MTKDRHCHSPPPELARAFAQHRQWLHTGGAKGVRLGTDQDESLAVESVTLEGIDLSLAQLSSTVFRDCDFRRAWLIGTDLSGSVFDGCDLSAARFNRADLSFVRFIQSNYSAADLDGAKTDETHWTRLDAEFYAVESDVKIKRLAELKKAWSKADWTAYDRECEELAKFRKTVAEIETRRDLALWRRLKAGPQPL